MLPPPATHTVSPLSLPPSPSTSLCLKGVIMPSGRREGDRCGGVQRCCLCMQNQMPTAGVSVRLCWYLLTEDTALHACIHRVQGSLSTGHYLARLFTLEIEGAHASSEPFRRPRTCMCSDGRKPETYCRWWHMQACAHTHVHTSISWFAEIFFLFGLFFLESHTYAHTHTHPLKKNNGPTKGPQYGCQRG